MKFFILISICLHLSAFYSSAAGADEKSCTPADIRWKMGSARNQNGTGWCFGYTAADLITQFMVKPGSSMRQKVSAVDLAMMYYKSETKLVYLDKQSQPVNVAPAALLRKFEKKSNDLTGIWGGHLDHTLNLAIEQGVCLEKDLHSGDVKFNEAVSIIQALASLRAQEPEKPTVTSCEMNYDVAQMIFPNLKKEEFIQIMQSSSGIDYMYKLRDAACKNRLKIPVDLEVTKDEQSWDSQKNKLDDFLNKETAVGLSIYSKAFKPNAPGEHGMSIVGRRYNKETKECEYLLRDSKGIDCSYYFAEHTKNCEQGHVWMKTSELKNNAKYLVYVKPKQK